jgi:NADP-dependent 3-hydroxy acid dehydrogenase YdfG
MDKKVIVITGASGGIGAAVARQLAGNQLVLGARRAEELEQVARECGPEALALPTDVTDRDSVARLFDATLQRFSHIDVWINNAGRGITRRVLDLTDADIDDMIQVNVKSALYGMQVAVPHFMERGRGHLINVSSFLAKMPVAPMRSAYSAAKAALNSLSETLRFDLRSYPEIRITVVMPGLVSTDFARNAAKGVSISMPAPRNVPAPQTAEEVASVIADVIENPRDEVFTNPASVEMLKQAQTPNRLG